MGDVNTRLPFLYLLAACGTPVGSKGSSDTGTDVSAAFGGAHFEPSTVNFGSVPPDSSASESVTLTNVTSVDIYLSIAFSSGDGFDIESELDLPLTVEPDAEVDITISFRPTELQDYDGTLNIGVAGEVGYGEIALQGTGSLDSGGGDSGSPSGSGELTVNPENIAFGEAGLTDVVWRSVELSNVGGSELLVTSISTSNPMIFQSEPEFTLPKLLRPSTSAVVQVGFSPTEMRDYTGVLDIDTDSAGGGALVPLSGTGSDSSCGICAPVMSVSTSSGGSDTLELAPPFGIGCTANGSITVTNTGDMDLDVSDVSVSNDLISTCGTFSHSWSGPTTLTPGTSTMIGVDYVATETCIDIGYPDFDQNVIHIRGTDPDNPEHEVTLEGNALFCG